MMQKVQVHKIGGAALAEPPEVLRRLVKNILKDSDSGPIIFVVSAIGKQTRLLDEMFQYRWSKNHKDLNRKFQEFAAFHRERIKILDLNCKKMEQFLWDMELDLHRNVYSSNKSKERAAVLKYGELASSLIFSSLLKRLLRDHQHIDGRSIISTTKDSIPDKARVDFKSTEEKMICHFHRFKKNIILTEGFIARDSDSGDDTLLDFDGSDYTAAVITRFLLERNEVSLTYWKDVEGVIDNYLEGGKSVIENMTIRGYIRMFPLGTYAPVRPDSIQLLNFIEPNNLEINIRSYKNLDLRGTIIKP